MHGRDPIFPFDQIINRTLPRIPQEPERTVDDFKEQLIERLNTAWSIASDAMAKNRIVMAKHHDKRAKVRKFQTGQLVLFKNYVQRSGDYRKFRPFWRGPYRVTNIEEDGLHCHVKPINDARASTKRVHMNQITSFHHSAVTDGSDRPIRTEDVSAHVQTQYEGNLPKTSNEVLIRQNQNRRTETNNVQRNNIELNRPDRQTQPEVPQQAQIQRVQPMTTRYGRQIRRANDPNFHYY
jgi:hypothetical protein